jgi:hypothetical protein
VTTAPAACRFRHDIAGPEWRGWCALSDGHPVVSSIVAGGSANTGHPDRTWQRRPQSSAVPQTTACRTYHGVQTGIGTRPELARPEGRVSHRLRRERRIAQGRASPASSSDASTRACLVPGSAEQRSYKHQQRP